MSNFTFLELGLPTQLLEAIHEMGFESPSPIQVQTIPLALQGHDLIGLSETGSGKTAAFALPTLAKIDLKKNSPQALIICPTRELAVQVCEEVHELAKKMPNLRALPVYGGAPIDRQLKALSQGIHLIVGTPGRLLDHLKRKSFNPKEIHTVVLDEADRMLDMGFQEEMETLLAALPADRQTLFFSATMNRRVNHLIQNFGNQPQTVEIERKSLTVDAIDQSCYEVRQRSKIEVLSRLLDLNPPRLTVVFCNTKRLVDEVTEALLVRGFSADRLHGDMTQQMRERTLTRFRQQQIEILVATDVAARGLDVDEIDLVVNYEIPHDPEDYVHRIGRTGRAGRKGRAVSFVFGRDIYRLQTIEKYTRQSIRRERVPSQEQVEGTRANQLFLTIQSRLEEGKITHYEAQLDRLLEQGHTATDIACAAITLLRESTSREGEFIAEDHEKDAFASERPRSNWRDRDEKGKKGDRGKRGDHDEKGSRKPFDSSAPRKGSKGMACLSLNLGKTHKVRPGDLAGMIYREANIPEGSLGKITILAKETLVDVKQEHAADLIKGLRNAKLRGRTFSIDFHKK